MTNIDNFLSLARRNGYNKVPIDFHMCPSLEEKFNHYVACNNIEVNFPQISIPDIQANPLDLKIFNQFYDHDFKKGTVIDQHGVAHEPGSEAAFHMTKMYHPMANFDSVEQILAYPFLDYTKSDGKVQKTAVENAHSHDKIAIGSMQCTVWETAWYMRGMENLMMDMMTEDPMAEILLDKVTDNAILRAESFVRSGVDVLFLGDDIGMQKSIMMSEDLYCTWLKPRIKKVIDAAKLINSELLVFYHSCGYVTPFIPHLIEVGVNVLNPIQPECMDLKELHSMYGTDISFHGGIGTQTTMPFGTPDEVRRQVFESLDIAGDKGGLLVAPTHLLEPEVPVENIIAYIKACNDYK